MPEYFIQAHSFAAPFCSDESTASVQAPSPEAALDLFASAYSHPAGLYAARAFADAAAMCEGQMPLAVYRSFLAQELEHRVVVTFETSRALREKHGTRGAVVRAGADLDRSRA